MTVTQRLRELGQSIWLHGLTRDLLNSGSLRECIEGLGITGLTFDVDAFAQAIQNSTLYDAAIRKKLAEEKWAAELFFELALEDVRYAADHLRPIYDQSEGVDGWVSTELSPLSYHDSASLLAAARELQSRAMRLNILVTIPGTAESLDAIEEAIAAGVPVNVALLFSREQYVAAADAVLRGLERRISAGLTPNVCSVASFSISPWDAAATERVPDARCSQLGVAMAGRMYRAYRKQQGSRRWERVFNAGARPQRLLWACTESGASRVFVDYINQLAAPLTIIKVSKAALEEANDAGIPIDPMPADGGNCEEVVARCAETGIDIDALADRLQREAVDAKFKSWIKLMGVIASRSADLATANPAQGR